MYRSDDNCSVSGYRVPDLIAYRPEAASRQGVDGTVQVPVGP